MTTHVPLKLAIVKAPRFPQLEQFKGVLTALSFLFGFGCVFGLQYLRVGSYIDFIIETGTIPTRGEQAWMYIILILLTLFFFAYAIGSILRRKLLPVTKRYPDIGYLYLSPDTMKAEMLDGSEDWEASFDQLSRIDCFFGMGLAPQTNKGYSTYDQIMVIRMLISRLGKENPTMCRIMSWGMSASAPYIMRC